PAAGRLQTTSRNARSIAGSGSRRIGPELAGWPHQNVFDAAYPAISPGTRRSLPAWRIPASGAERNIFGMLRQFCAFVGRQMDCCDGAAAFFATWVSYGW